LAGNYFLLRENYERYFEQALKVRRLIWQDFESVFNEGVHLLLTPVTLTEALSYREWVSKDNREQASREDYLTQPANMAGIPALSVPCLLSSTGLPLSLQLMGPRFRDLYLLAAGRELQKVVQFPGSVCCCTD
jgi:aspartyl-tRNA(Asn)/glutamyl-tRNA(Gln) amidotransferase subunit A